MRGGLNLVAAVLTCLAAGCFDSQALTQAKLEQAERMELEAVDLGKFRMTLPKGPGSAAAAAIEFHAFGQVAKRDLKAVEKEIAHDAAELRNHMLIAVRSLNSSDFEDPDLTALRKAIARIVNEELEGDPVENVGFTSLRFAVL